MQAANKNVKKHVKRKNLTYDLYLSNRAPTTDAETRPAKINTPPKIAIYPPE